MTHPPEPRNDTARMLLAVTGCHPQAVEDLRRYIAQLTAERDAALANAMPAGCVATCRMCGKNAAWYGPNCEAANCPLMRRLKAAISAAAKTTQEPT